MICIEEIKRYTKYIIKNLGIYLVIGFLSVMFLTPIFGIGVFVLYGATDNIILSKIILFIICYTIVYVTMNRFNKTFIEEHYGKYSFIKRIKFNIIASFPYIIQLIMLLSFISE